MYAGEFVIAASATTGLAKTTKFDLVNTHALPFDTEWFGAAVHTDPRHPRRGKLGLADFETKRRLQAAILE